MKKSVVCFIIILFIILFSILFFKTHLSNTKYSNEDIYALVQKGIKNMQDMQNVCIERKNAYAVVKYYYKGNKMKSLFLESSNDSSVSYSIIDLDKEKQYIISDEKKNMIIQETTNLNKGLQYEVFDRINTEGTNLKRELSYIKDETIEEKDCIFVKEITYYRTDDGTFQADSELDVDIQAYWIEKSTGFVLGAAIMKSTQTNATPETWIKSITFNEVVDSDFDLPTDYEIIDSSE